MTPGDRSSAVGKAVMALRVVTTVLFVALLATLPGCGDGTTVQKTRFSNGQLATELTVRPAPGGGYVNDGPYTTYYESGQVKERGTYRFGQLEGVATHYWDNGQKKAESTWKEGRLIGAWKYWDRNGQPTQPAGAP